MKILHYTLPNGIQIAHKKISSKVVCCGITINAGTRDELEGERGLAHFIEHVIFKGTKTKDAKAIAQVIEADGGELNAFTTKEETVLHCTLLKDGFEAAVELMADLIKNATFPRNELEKEKEVIRDEINSYHDNPAELIFDRFEAMVFAGDPIGQDILGTKKDLRSFNPTKIRRFIERTYNTDQMVFSVVGDFSEQEIHSICDNYFGSIPTRTRNFKRPQTLNYQPSCSHSHRDTYQAHCIIGNRAYNLYDKERYALSLLINLLGGPCQNSWLNQSLREDRGLVYNVEASYSPYSDSGIFNIYFGCDKKNLDTCLNLIEEQFHRLCNEALSDSELKAAKKQFIGQLSIAAESYEQSMLNMGKSLLTYGKIETSEESLKQLEAVSAEDIRRIARILFDPGQLSQLIFK